MCNCCWDFYLTTNRAVRAQNQMHMHTHTNTHAHTEMICLSLRADSSTPSVWFLFTVFISSSSPCSGFCAPVFADPVLSQRPPAGQRVQKAAKIKKKAVCNKLNKTKTLWPLSCHFRSFFFFFNFNCVSALL